MERKWKVGHLIVKDITFHLLNNKLDQDDFPTE